MVRYKVTQKVVCVEGNKYVSYGVCAVDENGRVTARVSDISTNKSLVLAFCKKCNRCKLSPLHLKEAAEDCVLSL